ncbi:tissue factor pathway inhibitor-like [Perca fluviatilis]|uniref:tissue factor pathway inhibitor-like n=1 Tax=Perca fluviatilis TaxID=8168 RepID=UPI0019648B75|nr:tissue factor pathway inhibitor-like [Perca fluviatilis]
MYDDDDDRFVTCPCSTGRTPSRFSTGIRDTTVNFFFYNVSSGSCEGFHFRGSASNGNIFRTVKECESLCGDVKDRCLDFMKYSSCQSESPRFFYNRTSSRCEQLFGDCRSNNKTFGTLESCEALCYGNGRPLSEDPGKNKILSGIIVLMVVFLVIVAIVVLLVQYCRHASSNGFRLVVSDP